MSDELRAGRNILAASCLCCRNEHENQSENPSATAVFPSLFDPDEIEMCAGDRDVYAMMIDTFDRDEIEMFDRDASHPDFSHKERNFGTRLKLVLHDSVQHS